MRLRFTTPSRKARWRWWVGTALILLLWLIGGSLVSLIVLPWTGVDLGTFIDSLRLRRVSQLGVLALCACELYSAPHWSLSGLSARLRSATQASLRGTRSISNVARRMGRSCLDHDDGSAGNRGGYCRAGELPRGI